MQFSQRVRGSNEIPKDASYPACRVKYDVCNDGKFTYDEDITQMIDWYYVVEYSVNVDIIKEVKSNNELVQRKWYEFWK